MYLLDANVLLALTSPAHVHHRAAHAWFAGTTGDGWATTPMTETALLRLACNPAVMGAPVQPTVARSVLSGLRALAGWQFLPDHTTLAEPAIDLTPLTGHRQMTDFHLVNLAATHHARLATFDARLPTALAPADRRHVHCIRPFDN